MLEDLSHYEKLAEEIFEPEVLAELRPEERRVIGMVVYRTIRKLKRHVHDEYGFKIKAALNAARSRGVKLGRPRRDLDCGKIREMRSQGFSYQKLAQVFGCGRGTIQRILQETTRSSPIVVLHSRRHEVPNLSRQTSAIPS